MAFQFTAAHHEASRASAAGLGQVFLMTLVALSGACSGDRTPAEPAPRPDSMATVARAYLDEIITTMHDRSVNRFEIDWDTFREDVMVAAGNAQNIRETYAAIEVALRLLQDNHSSFVSADGDVVSASPACEIRAPTRLAFPPSIAYVRLGCCGTPADVYGQNIQNAIRQEDGNGIEGWIVDLRANTGGNMYPMIAGVGPILGEGPAGRFVDPAPDVADIVWSYSAGQALYDGHVFAAVTPPYRLQRPNPKVAVLIDGGTASSGEGVAISFRARPDTRFFGLRTCGRATGVMPFRLSNGATLALATAYMADRTRAIYPEGVVPDEIIEDDAALFQRAIEWLLDSTGEPASGRIAH
jgi:hypothetical protein